MGVLEKLNKLKVLLKEISSSTEDLPKEIKPEVDENLKVIRTLVNNVGGSIEKYFKDQRTFKKIGKDIRNRMDELEIYKGLSDKRKNAIVNKIVNDKDMVLVDSSELSEFIKDKLKTDSVENLIRKAYSKKDIIKLGEAVTEPDAGEVMKYDAGMDILRDMVKTPTGQEDAITYGIKRLMGNSTTLQYYLMLYYQL